MLNDTTKRKINSLRQILVGKVPDPKSQVDQITNALIYKYMDDMDRQAEAFGGKAAFFVGEYEQYSWRKLMDPKLGGQERMNLYVEALEKMSGNKNLSPIFRQILRGAFLPYRSPETLNLFLTEINSFTYEHSEELGNAYEYLLSIMGAQGDAGQFRTPRHIIDFIVEVVDPGKGDTILDPACGTAGFLISAYKHITGNHDGKDNETGKPTKEEKGLSPKEMKELHKNFVGYDISPEMGKLSRVNMFLHSFPEPKIFEYDTLSDDSRWEDKFDVILANPPFMSPKGGIIPHKRFSIPATRAEVLFVDYIMEHLKPKSRAGIIIPEGVIFKNDTSYKQLRKTLVEDGLYAVVSLPPGVFNPYSSVKTNILFFDNNLSKKTDEVLFIKVLNDGFDLGAQRRPRPDLPNDLFDEGGAIDVLKAQKIAIENRSKNKLIQKNSRFAWSIKKEIIAESGDYRLSGDFYQEDKDKHHHKWDTVELGDVLDYEQPTKYIVKSVNYSDDYPTPVLTAGKTFILGRTNEIEGICKEGLPVIIFDDFTTATKFVDFPFKVKSSAMKILYADESKADTRFLFHLIQKIKFPVNEHKRYWISEYSKIKIPLPPLSVQKEIIKNIKAKEQEIEKAKNKIIDLQKDIDHILTEI